MTAATIFTAFSQSAGAAAGRAALITSRASFSYRALHADILLATAGLRRHSEQCPVVVLSSDAKALLTIFLACAAIGRPALILDPALPPAEIERLTGKYRARILAPYEQGAPAFAELDSLMRDARPADAAIALPAVASEAEFYWGLTSGTTAEPKLFARSHRSWLESFAAMERAFAFPESSQILIPGPLSHSLFLYGAVHALCRGHTVLAPGAFRPDRAVTAARGATHAYAVPSMLAEMLRCGLSETPLRLIFSGGAKLSGDLRRHCEADLPAADLVEFYGASETSFITAHSTRAPAPNGSVGRAFPSVAIEIRGAGGAVLPFGGEGEVFVKSPMLFSRYVDGPLVHPSKRRLQPEFGQIDAKQKAHERSERAGARACEWFTAGDIGFLDRQGFLYLTGRKNRVINSRALKIRPEAIEQALMELPGVHQAAVVDLPDAKRGSIAVAAIAFEPGAALVRRTLSAYCRTRLGARLCPQRYYHAEAMPMTRSGKIAFTAVREALLAHSPAFRELR